MRFYEQPEYSLRYDKHGRKKEVNLLSPILTAPEFSIDEVEEELREEYRTVRRAIQIAQKNEYDMDIFATRGALRIDIYKDFYDSYGFVNLMQLFGKADFAGVYNHKRGKSVVFTAFYLFTDKKREACKQK